VDGHKDIEWYMIKQWMENNELSLWNFGIYKNSWESRIYKNAVIWGDHDRDHNHKYFLSCLGSILQRYTLMGMVTFLSKEDFTSRINLWDLYVNEWLNNGI